MSHQHAFLRAATGRHGRLVITGLAAVIGLAVSRPGTAGDTRAYDASDSYATLVYSIEIDGRTHEENAKAGTYADATVHRRLDGHARLKGTLGHGSSVDNAEQVVQQAEPLRQAMMPAIQQAMATCGDDEACMTAAMMKMSASMSPAQREMAKTAKARMTPKLSRHDFGGWGLDPSKPQCSLHAVTQGSSRYRSLDVGEGYADYVTGSEKRHGEGHYDCATRHESPEQPRIVAQWKGDTGILALDLPGLAVDEQATDAHGKTTTRRVVIDDIELHDLHWSGKGPQSGQRTRKVTVNDVPATLTVRWTFTPGKA